MRAELGLRLEEVFVFYSKSLNKDRVRDRVRVKLEVRGGLGLEGRGG